MFYKLPLDGVNVFVRHLPHPQTKPAETSPDQGAPLPALPAASAVLQEDSETGAGSSLPSGA